MKKLLLFSMFILVNGILQSQTFEKAYENVSNTAPYRQTEGESIIRSYNNKFNWVMAMQVIGNSVFSAPGFPTILQMDDSGTIIKFITFDQNSNFRLYFGAASTGSATKDNGIIIACTNDSDEGALIKLDSTCNVQWIKTYGDNGPYYDRLVVAKETSDNNYIVVGTSGSFSNAQASIFVLKVSNTGNIIWNKTFGLGGDEDGMDVIESGGNFYVLGYGTGHYGYTTTVLIKLDANGSLIYGKIIKPSVGGSISRRFIEKKDKTGFLLSFDRTLKITNDSIMGNMVIVDLDYNCVVNWAKEYKANARDNTGTIKYAKGGGVLLSGFHISSKEDNIIQPYWHTLLKTDYLGNPIWYKMYQDTASFSKPSYAIWAGIHSNIEIAPDNGCFILGTSYRDSTTANLRKFKLCLMKTDSLGNTPCSRDVSFTYASIAPVIADVTSSLDILSGAVSTSRTPLYVTEPLVNTYNCSMPNGVVVYPKYYFNSIVYPNPFSTAATIKFDYEVINNANLLVIDIYGRTVKTISQVSSSQIEINRENMSNGLYFYKLNQKDKIIASGKFIVQ